MKRTFVIIFALIAIIFQSCLPSLHPLYTPDKLIAIKELPGSWMAYENGKPNQPTSETWNFKKGDDLSYHLIHTDKQGRKAAFKIHTVQLGKHYFMDFFPMNLKDEDAQATIELNSMEEWHFIPVHTFAKLEITTQGLQIHLFDPDFLENLLKNQQIRIKHEVSETGYLLTASSQELQKFVEKYADEKAAFLTDPVILKQLN